MVALRLLLAAIAIVGGTACSGARQPASARGPAPAPTSGIEDGAPCPAALHEDALPERAGCVTRATGTFEEGETRQQLIAYALLDDEGLPSTWHMRVTRADGPPVDRAVRVGSTTSYLSVLGAADADRDGLDEAFVRVLTHLYHSGATHEVSIFGVENERIFQVEADGEPLRFPVGGISTFGEGAECRDIDLDGEAEFLLLRVDYAFGEIQRWNERVYRWANRSLEFVTREQGRMAKTGYSDPLLYRYYSLRCFDFEPPFPYVRG